MTKVPSSNIPRAPVPEAPANRAGRVQAKPSAKAEDPATKPTNLPGSAATTVPAGPGRASHITQEMLISLMSGRKQEPGAEPSEERPREGTESGRADQKNDGGGVRRKGAKKGGALARFAKALRQAGADGFEKLAARTTSTPLKAEPASTATQPREPSLNSPLAWLNNAKDPGVYFREIEAPEEQPLRRRGDGPEAPAVDPELLAAVADASRLLAGVKGITRIGPGEDEAGAPVVLIVANRGFGETSLAAVPKKVRRFKTLLALPYELLPLRRTRA